jgi:hypothetical protein
MNEAFSTLSCSDFDVNSILMIFTSKLESTLKLVSGDPNENLFREVPRQTLFLENGKQDRWHLTLLINLT